MSGVHRLRPRRYMPAGGIISTMPFRFYAVACTTVVLAVAALLFSLQEDSPAIAAGAFAVAAIGCFVAARMVNGDRR